MTQLAWKRVSNFVNTTTAILLCVLANPQPAAAGDNSSDERAIKEACPERFVFGAGVPAGYRFDPKLGYITRCKSVAEGVAAVAEEKAIHEACPKREEFGRGVDAGFMFDQKLGYIRRCLPNDVGLGSAVAKENPKQQEGMLKRPQNQSEESGGQNNGPRAVGKTLESDSMPKKPMGSASQ